MSEPEWSTRIRERFAGRPIVVVGIGPDQLRSFAHLGARIVGTVSVVPAGAPPVAAGHDLLALVAASRDILDVVVSGFARALADAGGDVGGFLDRVDPERRATVASYLPLPHDLLGGREAWAQDSSVTAALEEKATAARVLARCVPVIPSEPMPAGSPRDWWVEACARLGADRLVIQAAGLSGGGTGTFVCASPADVPALAHAAMAPYVAGVSANVMGVVDDAGGVVVLPASRQLLRHDAHGRPLYAGNVTGEAWAAAERRVIGTEVRAVGRELATYGFLGPFGLDFIRNTDGRRLYHDLNPRMNGAADSLARLLDPSLAPLVAALLSRAPADQELEDALHTAASQRPLARLWLTTTATAPFEVTKHPLPGSWRVEGDRCTFVGEDRTGSDLILLDPTLVPGSRFLAGDRVVLGNLYCTPREAARLQEAGPGLVDAFLA